MFSKLIKLSAIPVVALAMLIAGCENVGGPEGLTGPGVGAPSFSDGTTETALYTAVKGVCDRQATRTVSKVVRRNGGKIDHVGNVLTIPRDAVLEPTLFVVEANNAGCKGKVDMFVRLEAYEKDTKGDYTVPVGHLGFLQPLELRLSTESISQKVDDTELRIVWQKTDGSQEVYQTVLDPAGKKVITWLNHFSDYILAVP